MRLRRTPFGHVPAERVVARRDVVRFATVPRRAIKRRPDDFSVGERNRKAVAELHQLAFVELLLLVRDVSAFACFPQPVALDRAGQDHRRRAAMVAGCVIGGVDLERIVSAQSHPPELVVRDVVDHPQEPRVDAPEVLADVTAAGDGVLLVLTVDDFAHALDQQALFVARQELVPFRAPDHLDHVPAHAAEDGLQLLDDLTVAPHRTVETLQIAVDDEDQVVELFARGERDRTERLGLVGLTVAEEAPDLAIGWLQQIAVFEVTDESRLVDRLDRSEPHRDGGELPVVVHQPGMRIRGQAAGEFAAELVQLIGRQPSLDVTARVDPGRRVALEVDHVAAAGMILTAEEVVEADLVQRRRRSVGRNVPADAVIVLIRLDDHRHRVPANDRLDPPFNVEIAGIRRLFLDRNGVDVGRLGCHRQTDAGTLRLNLQRLQQP